MMSHEEIGKGLGSRINQGSNFQRNIQKQIINIKWIFFKEKKCIQYKYKENIYLVLI